MKNKLCIKCGNCCKSIPCGIGFAIFGDHRPCAALEKKGNEYFCGLVLHPNEYIDFGDHEKWKNEWFSKLTAGMLGINFGCCSFPDKDRLLHQFRNKLKKHKYKNSKEQCYEN